ncbi:bacillithiol biosynthesis cysteine-adding enzyme BshC [Bacillus sp. FJAT-27251]|uniref:bacillithiol biosynthesis cysteine-adding enzyme BshC n=1 Tax=Bacillus sp. FJAT-27251 TaxID=1684142 RepID=UPI0006A786BE|nr:bacillithiol biosynthesis cysteine-adding enzyme BshC [Bacillus sp. FJAT-27251]
MEILNLSLPATNRFATGYLNGNKEVLGFFHYNFNEPSHYKERLKELSGRTFFRRELADHIGSFMSRYPSSDKIRENLDKLKQEDCVAVIGGQQAGLLTGPLYSVHKAISVIKLAEQKEKELGVPVVPLFWIAGEDHDFQEVNHVYVLNNNKPEKRIYPEKSSGKNMISTQIIDRDTCLSWIEDIIETFGETSHTNRLREFAEDALKESQSFIDFFASTILGMFKEHGLLLVDSGNDGLRNLEKEYFAKQIGEHEAITRSVLTQQEEIGKKGFSRAIDISPNAANLFYNDENGERVLLHFDDASQCFTGREGEISFTPDELQEIASEHPEKLSNNVVTRPLMQEWLFPTLAFVGGPGEIAYWSELKLVFDHFGLKMPPLVPRLNITILDRSVERDLAQLNLKLEEVLKSGTSKHELSFIDALRDREVEGMFAEAKKQLIEQYRKIHDKAGQLDKGLIPLVKKNEDLLLKQIAYMEKKVDESICRKHDDILAKFARVENALRPGGSPQERVWNPFYYLNQYGLDFFSELLSLPLVFDGSHKVIKM